jgi:hypothetical protein
MKSERLLIIGVILLAIVFIVPRLKPILFETASEHAVNKFNIHYFDNLVGPKQPTPTKTALFNELRPHQSLERYAYGKNSRMAVLLTTPNPSWLGLAHALKTFGIPFIITTNVAEALQHKVVFTYPELPGKLDSSQLDAIRNFPARGGTLIATNVLGGGMSYMFGFDKIIPSKDRHDIHWNTQHPLASDFLDPREKVATLGHDGLIGSYSFTNPAETPLAKFEDNTAAITQRHIGNGRAYAFGVDLGYYLISGYNNPDLPIARCYVNQLEPSLDTMMRVVKRIYQQSEPNAVTVWTVPKGKDLSVIYTHDIDYAQSIVNAVEYAKYEKAQGIRGTYFTQVKYIKDFNDEHFFNKRGVRYLKQLDDLGMEIASHSVSHSRQYSRFKLGTGNEMYPTYVPLVINNSTTYNGTVLGELRVSKFLLDNFRPSMQPNAMVTGRPVVSFRPGVLSVPRLLPEAMEATGYLYSSSVTADNSLTHMPFQLNYTYAFRQEAPVFEFPITIEDEEKPKMGSRIQPAIDLANKLKRYGALFVVLIHPNVLDHKLAFEKQLTQAVKPYAWFGSISDFGDWWSARNEVQVDVIGPRQVQLQVPKPIDGLSVVVPTDWTLKSVKVIKGNAVTVTQSGQRVQLTNQFSGNAVLSF